MINDHEYTITEDVQFKKQDGSGASRGQFTVGTRVGIQMGKDGKLKAMWLLKK
jgi:hypothetical protein